LGGKPFLMSTDIKFHDANNLSGMMRTGDKSMNDLFDSLIKKGEKRVHDYRYGFNPGFINEVEPIFP